ncbi:hypothetical protein PY093_19990 [Cytobacillus sp. S13-E01]|nr:hypothetical protein [Cytobacillus sp. S13-E01]
MQRKVMLQQFLKSFGLLYLNIRDRMFGRLTILSAATFDGGFIASGSDGATD